MKTNDRVSSVPALGVVLCASLCAFSLVAVAQAAPVEDDKPSRGSPIHRWGGDGGGDGSTGVKAPAEKPPRVDIDSRLVPGSKTADPIRKAAWNAANQQAKRRIADFDKAVKSGNADAIRKATLDLQSDPLAVQHLNKSGRADLVEFHNQQTQSIRDATKRNIQEEMARRWNAENPHDPIKPADVEIFEPTNFRKPGAEPHVGQDWDVTVRVRGQDVPPSKAKGVVEDSFFKAAGGEKTFGKGATPSDAAHRQSVEVTDSKSLESYKEPEKILGKDGQAPDHRQGLDNPEDLGRVIEHKSNQAANKANDARKGGNEVEAVRQDYEQMRQAVKQYDKITDPRVKGQGGKVGNQVEKGMEVMRKVADLEMSPEDGRARLAEMGETPDSITRKAAGQIEAAQKLKPQTAGDGAKTQTANEGGKATTADDGGKVSGDADAAGKADTTARGDAPDRGKAQTADDGGKVSGDADTAGKADTTARGDAPDRGKAQTADDGGKVSGDADTAGKADTTARGDAPDRGKAQTADDGGKVSGDADTAGKADTTARGDAPDRGKAQTADDGGKVSGDADTAGKADTTARGDAAEGGKAQTADDGGKVSGDADTAGKADTTARGDAPDRGKAQTADDGGKVSGDADAAGKADTTARGDAPDTAKPTTDGGKTAAGSDTAAKPDTTARGDAPDTAKPTTDGGKTVAGGDAEGKADTAARGDAPDGGRVAAGDAPKAAVPDGPKVGAGDAPKVSTPDAPGGKMAKAGKAAGKVVDAAGKFGDGIDIFAGAKDFSDAAKEGDTEKMAEAAINTADSMTGGALATGKLVDERMQAKEQTDREYEQVDRQLEEAKRQQMRVDLRKEGYSRDEADKMVDSYAAGDDSDVKEAYGKMGKAMPKAGTAAPETASEAAGIYVEEVKENAAEAWEGMKTQAVKAKDFLVETKDNLGEIGGGIVAEEGVAEALAEQVKENVSAENFNVAREAWKTSADADKQIDEARQEMEDRLVEKGWSRTKAKVEADHQYDRREKGDTAKELAKQVKENVSAENFKEGYDAWRQNRESKSREADARKELVEKFVGEGFDREEAQQAVDDFYGVNHPEGKTDKSKFKEMVREVKARNLRDAEANGEGEEDEEDDEEGGGLKGFKSGRTAKTDANAESSYGLMGQEQNLAEASTRGDQAEADAKNVVAAAGADAQATSGKAAASSAAADREEGWGKAIADGVQQGVEAGATALGSSFGDTAGKHASDAAFGDPHEKKHGGKGGGKGEEGDGGEQVAGGGPGGAAGGAAVKSAGGGKGGGSSANKGKHGGKSPKKAASGKKPGTQSASGGQTIKCPKCGGTKFGPYEVIYETGTVIGRDRRCLTCGHMGGVIVGGSSAPSAPKPAPAAPAPPPVKMKRVATHASCGSEMKFEGVYYADGTDMYSCPKCGGTYHNVGGAPAIIFKEVPDTSAP